MVRYYQSKVTKNNQNANFFLELGDMIANKLKDCKFTEEENKFSREDNESENLLYGTWISGIKEKEKLITEILAIILSKGNKRNVIIPNKVSVSNGEFYYFRRTSYAMPLDTIKKNLTEFAHILPVETLPDVEYLLLQYSEEEMKTQFTTELRLDKVYNFYETDAENGTLISFDTLSLTNKEGEVKFSVREGNKEELDNAFSYEQVKKRFSKEFKTLKEKHSSRFKEQIKWNEKIVKDLKEKYAEHFAFKRLTESAK